MTSTGQVQALIKVNLKNAELITEFFNGPKNRLKNRLKNRPKIISTISPEIVQVAPDDNYWSSPSPKIA